MSRHKHAYDEKYLHNEEQAWELIQERPEQFYVYVLINPLNNLPFYVGKGQGNRCFTHWNRGTMNDFLYKFFRKLRKKTKTILYAFQEFTDDEQKAYNIESKFISRYGLRSYGEGGILLNSKEGNGPKAMAYKQKYVLNNFKEVHGDKYDYSKVNYKGNNFPVDIICPKHKVFSQRVGHHLNGHGCPKCAVENSAYMYSKGTKAFVDECLGIYNDLYDYSKVNYVNQYTLVDVICNSCKGVFSIEPKRHLNGQHHPFCVEVRKELKRRQN